MRSSSLATEILVAFLERVQADTGYHGLHQLSLTQPSTMTTSTCFPIFKFVSLLLAPQTAAALYRDPDVDYSIFDLNQQISNVGLAVNKNKETFTRTDKATNQSVLALKMDLEELEFDNLIELVTMAIFNLTIALVLVYNYYSKTCGTNNVASALKKMQTNIESLVNAGLKNVHFEHDQVKIEVRDLSVALQREKTVSKQLAKIVESATEDMKAALAKQDELNDKISYMQQQQRDNLESGSN